MIIHDFDRYGSRTVPGKANAPLVVDPDTPLAAPITFERLQPVARRYRQILQPTGRIDDLEFVLGPLDQIGRIAANPLALEEAQGPFVAEPPLVDHRSRY